MSIVRVGVIGYGFSAKVFQIPLIVSLPNLFSLSYIVSKSLKDSTIQIRGKDVQVLKTSEELFAKEDVDLVVITSPTDSHAKLCSDAIKHKKHVIVEKPFTATAEEAERIHKEASESDVIVSVYQNRRWDGDFLTLSKLVKNNTLGRVVNVHSRFDRFRPQGKGGWRETNVEGGGVLLDLGAHLMDQAVALFGVPTTIYAIVQHQRGLATDDSFHIILSYINSSGEELVVQLSAGIHVRIETPRFTVHGTKGAWVKSGLDVQEPQLISGVVPIDAPTTYGVETEQKWGTLDTDVNDVHFVGKTATEKGNYVAYYQNIGEAIQKKDKNHVAVTTKQAVITMKLLDLAKQSSATKSVIKVNL